MAVRGQLRVYLGAAPGVGKTYAMLAEAHRRAGRGTDVAVGYVETHGRAHTAEMLDGLEVVPRKTMTYRGAQFTELDAGAVIARRPQVVLIDELAHTNIPGSKNGKRRQDIEEILDAGITVITNLNIQHLESLNDVVRQITGVVQRETVPDEVVRRADQVELVDMAPEALRRRMAHGNIYPAEKIDAALGNYFRVGNLTALRELALLWTAGKVDEQLERYRADHGIAGTWEAREHARKEPRRLPASGGLTARRRLVGFTVAAAGLPLATVLLASLRGHLSLPSDILTVMAVVVAAAITGGFWPGITAAAAGFLLLNYYFTEPYHTFVISHPDDVLALAVFLAVAAAVSAVVGLAARRTLEAARAGTDAEVLFNLAGNILRGEHALTALLGRLQETFGQESVTLLEHRPGAPITPGRQRDPRPGRWPPPSAEPPAAHPTRAIRTFRLARTWRWYCAAGRCRPPAAASPRPSLPRRPPRCASSD